VAAALEIDVNDVYRIGRAYRTSCMALWSRLFGLER
jgi:hypothetical protein